MMALTRRALLSAMALTALARPARADDPLIIRPEIQGVDPRYARYAQKGPYVHPAAPKSFVHQGVRIVVFSPLRAESGRLIVFSHGALADPHTYSEVLWHWASHGFVVAAPIHADSIIDSGPTIRRARPGSFSEWPVATLLEDPAAWRARAQACSACVDAANLVGATVGMEVVTDRPVIAGHGYGAYVAQALLGAAMTDADGSRRSFADPRFFSGVLMSPQGPGVMGLDDTSWRDIRSPALFLVAENDTDFTGQPWQEKAKAYRLAMPGYKHIGFLRGGSSNAFTGHIARTNASEALLFQALLAMTTAYLKAYADYDREAFGDMTNDLFERMTLGAVDEGRR